ncbi:MAG TPA: hypothetical protein VE981_07615 [Planctomycetota bacterium]|nr:hypothetical protein [Planctomycetota bacterium]
MPMSGMWTPDQAFKCTDFNCGCEFKMVNPPQARRPTPLEHPHCLCGSPMKRWPEAALRSDAFNDV